MLGSLLIVGFALSCRVIGLGVEHRFMAHILEDLASSRAGQPAQLAEGRAELYAGHG